MAVSGCWVEAARAGEAGARFAVVAEEVRSLARRLHRRRKTLPISLTKVNHGKNVLKSTNDTFKEVNTASTKVGGLITEIATASKEQAMGLEQISKAITQMDSVTQQNSANAEESAVSVQELNTQAGRLIAMVDGLRQTVEGGTAESKDAEGLPAAKNRLAIGQKHA